MSWNIFLILLQINSFSAQKLLENIREDYCEIYCKDECKKNNSGRTCRKVGSFFVTNDYTLHLKDGYLKIEAIKSDIKQWTIARVSNETNVKLRQLYIVGSSNNSTLRPGVFYLRDLGVPEAETYYLFGQDFYIYERRPNYLKGSADIVIYANRFTDLINEYIQISLNHRY